MRANAAKWLVLLTVVCLSVTAVADVVYLTNGKKLRGKATREGDVVVVRTVMGVRRVPAKDVLYISRPKKEPDANSSPDANSQSEPEPVKLDPDKTTTPYRKSRFSIGTASQPESIVFALMRSLEAGRAKGPALNVKGRIATWQRNVKDRQRRLDSRWVEPEEFIRRRKVFAEHLKDAQSHFSKARRHRGRDATAKRLRKQYEAAGYKKLRLAATAWTDPALRLWLQGVAALKTEQPKTARSFFTRAIKENAHVAGFHQGLAKAELADDRGVQAVEACLTLIQFRPEEREAVELLGAALKKVPGSALKHPTYLAGREVFGQYPPMRRRRRSDSWLMPGKDLRDDEHELPVPEYDRLAVRQGTGVALAGGGLVIDRTIAQQAVAALVQVDANTIVPAEIKSRSIFGRDADSDVELAILEVPGVTFSPVTYDEDATFERGTVVKTFGLESWAEMGNRVYEVKGQITTTDPNRPSVSCKLAPGDAAAPVLTEDKRLVGFLKGRTDPLVAGGGKNEFYSLADAEDILDRAVRYDAEPYRRRNAKPIAVENPIVKVYLLVAERFEE